MTGAGWRGWRQLVKTQDRGRTYLEERRGDRGVKTKVSRRGEAAGSRRNKAPRGGLCVVSIYSEIKKQLPLAFLCNDVILPRGLQGSV